MQGYWQQLGLDEATDDSLAIKRAYARRLKQTRPDDDPVAYQALREAYDWALGYARWHREEAARAAPDQAAAAPIMADTAATCDDGLGDEASAHPTDVANTDATDVSAETAPDFILPEQLARDSYQIWQEQGDEALIALLPSLCAWLDALPLALRGEASVWFAEFVLQHAQTPPAFIQALAAYFHWAQDFRADAQLGPERAEALRQRLNEAQMLPVRDPAIRARFAGLFQLDALRERWGHFRTTLVAGLHLPTLSPLLQHPPHFMHALGFQPEALRQLQRSLSQAGKARLWLLCALCALLLALQGERWLALLAGVLTPLLIFALGRGNHQALRLSRFLRDAEGQPRLPGVWRLGLCLGLPVLLIVLSQLFFGSPPATAWLWLVGAIVLLPTLLLATLGGPQPDPVDSYVGLLAAGLASLALQDLASEPVNRLCLVAGAFLWVNASLLYWQAERDKVEAFYAAPLQALRPSTAIGWIWLIFFFKVAIGLIVATLLITLPLSLRVQARRHGPGLVLACSLLAIGLNWQHAPVWVGAKLFACLILLSLLQSAANWLARRLLARAPAPRMP